MGALGLDWLSDWAGCTRSGENSTAGARALELRLAMLGQAGHEGEEKKVHRPRTLGRRGSGKVGR